MFSEIETKAIKPEQAIAVLEAASSRIGDCRGKFIVTPRLYIILKRAADQTTWLAVGQLDGPLTARPRERRPDRDRRPSDADLPPSERPDTQVAEWESRFAQALVDIGMTGQIREQTRTALEEDPRFPDAIKYACRTFETAVPATREPKALLTKTLLVEIIVSFRTHSRERVIECLSSLESRSEPWSASAASVIRRVLGELAQTTSSALDTRVELQPRDRDAASGAAGPSADLPSH